MQRTANDKRTALTTLISDALLPGEESKFLARKGTRHYARLCSAKSLGSLLYISNTAKKVPRYCFSCKSAEFQFVYYNNLKSWLTSKNMLKTYKIDIYNQPRGKAYFWGCFLFCARFVGFFCVISSVL